MFFSCKMDQQARNKAVVSKLCRRLIPKDQDTESPLGDFILSSEKTKLLIETNITRLNELKEQKERLRAEERGQTLLTRLLIEAKLVEIDEVMAERESLSARKKPLTLVTDLKHKECTTLLELTSFIATEQEQGRNFENLARKLVFYRGDAEDMAKSFREYDMEKFTTEFRDINRRIMLPTMITPPKYPFRQIKFAEKEDANQLISQLDQCI